LFAGSIRGFFAIRFNLLLPHFLILLFGHSDSLRRSQVIRSGC
jgi:Flp pilus assembly protein TadG